MKKKNKKAKVAAKTATKPATTPVRNADMIPSIIICTCSQTMSFDIYEDITAKDRRLPRLLRKIRLVGGANVYLVKTDEDRIDVVDFEGKTLKNYSFDPTHNTFSLALSKSGDGRRCDLVIYDENGEKQVIADSDYGCESLSSFKGVVATLDNNTIYVFDSARNQYYSCYAGAGAKRILLFSEREAYVLSVTQIRRIDFSKQASPDSAFH